MTCFLSHVCHLDPVAHKPVYLVEELLQHFSGFDIFDLFLLKQVKQNGLLARNPRTLV